MNALEWLLTAPVRMAVALARLIAARGLTHDAVHCLSCGGEIVLLGLWECGGCGYAFWGFFFSRCYACGARPPFLKCPHCEASMLNPLIP